MSMSNMINESVEQLQTLIAEETSSYRKNRVQIIAALKSGLRPEEVPDEVDTSIETVQRTWMTYSFEGLEGVMASSTRTSSTKMTPEVLEELIEFLSEAPFTEDDEGNVVGGGLELDDIHQFLTDKGVEYSSTNSMRAALKSAGVNLTSKRRIVQTFYNLDEEIVEEDVDSES